MLNTEQEILRIPPHPAGTIELLRAKGHVVHVRRLASGSLRYTIDQDRERTADQMSKFYARRYEISREIVAIKRL